MPANIYEKMVYSLRQPMWHGITEPSQEELGAEEIMVNRFDGGFSVKLAQSAYYTDDGEVVINDGKFTILRSPYDSDMEWAVFGECTDRYHPLQPIAVAQRFDEMVGVPVETLAFLGQGEDMFISWKLPSIDVRGTDTVDLYSIIRGGFDTAHGWNLFTAGVRPVCWNTITLAQNWANQNSGGNELVGNFWKGKGVNKDLLEHMGYWMQHLQNTAKTEVYRIEQFFNCLAAMPITSDAEVIEMLNEAYPNKGFNENKVPPELREKARKENKDANDAQARIRDGVLAMFKGQGTEITADYWGLLNSVTEFVCHYMPSKKPIAESVMFGNRASITGRMVKVLEGRL